PALLMVATAGAAELHVTVEVRSCIVLSLYVPVAVNCCVVPNAIEGVGGVTANDTSTAGVTVSVVESLTPLPASIAVIVVVPCAALVASPSLPPALLMIATAGDVELHVTVDVRSCVVLSLYVPVAANCCVVPSAIDGVGGVTANDTNTAGVTLSITEPFTLLPVSTAVIVVVPRPSADARPGVENEATEDVDAHNTVDDKSCVVLSL
ncbi:MAG: hypothetical protein ACI90M_001359, partial [Candidatus Azotimanducaceae bacterium]